MGKPLCQIVSSDYLDKDVYLNIRCFYLAAGYRLIPASRPNPEADLLVVLRGDNGSEQRDFRGEIHIYDYVKEYLVDWQNRYPVASRLVVVSLAASSLQPAVATAGAYGKPAITAVDAYLPVIPALWSSAWRSKQRKPLHISNFKRMGDDAYQQDLLALIRSGAVQAFGSKWDLVGVRTHPLSYLQANRVLAAAASCFGLMWPYQRGRTLSGRMWQAPLNGCFVLTETGTDILGCPGVIERQAFDASSASLAFSDQRCRQLAIEAAAFWEAHTRGLAALLGIDPALPLAGAAIRRQRWLLLGWDLEFRRQRLWGGLLDRFDPPIMAVRRRLARLARRLGLRSSASNDRPGSH